MPCRKTKEFLSSKGVQYREVNVAEDVEGREELVRRTGQLAVPVTVIDDEIVVGFNRPRLVELLGLDA
ncbi:MAG TPA: glutaredoxin domain-containing protein [Methylomirabilota bacterium]|nr:glutaredoxin domain-containing protein [Methylomirabilota bacterium]